MLFKSLTAAIFALDLISVQAADSVANGHGKNFKDADFFTISSLPKNETREVLMHELNYFAKLNSQVYCIFSEGWSDDKAGYPLHCDDNDFDNLELFDVWRPVAKLSAGTVTLFTSKNYSL